MLRSSANVEVPLTSVKPRKRVASAVKLGKLKFVGGWQKFAFLVSVVVVAYAATLLTPSSLDAWGQVGVVVISYAAPMVAAPSLAARWWIGVIIIRTATLGSTAGLRPRGQIPLSASMHPWGWIPLISGGWKCESVSVEGFQSRVPIFEHLDRQQLPFNGI
ncbi:hypothetical protein GUJ93_ZPchr0005g15607 [Zizania palustris]|uniref:Uncharacterized protein n=1 Tax=Zizania palustris TaxID=103762 RepID=A0A8J5T5N4_ZIZPA|nr:hypothetical protein GUJ93_ZPchr0005g15607 [Zizania palustris]